MQAEVKPPEFSVVVPVYQSAASLVELVSRIVALFDDKLRQSFEVIFVDDGSDRPETWKTLVEIAESDARVRAVRLMRNYGKPSAVLCGFTQVQGRWVITIDDDLQQSPEDIAALIEFRHHDVVVAAYSDKRHSWFVRSTSQVKALVDDYVLRLPVRMTPLKLIRRKIIDEILTMRAARPYIPALLAHVTHDFKAVPLQHHPSKAGKSRYTFNLRLRQFSNLIISNSSLFSRAWAVMGAVLLAIGLVLLLCVGVFSFSTGVGSGLVIAVLLTLGGMILIALGVVGEYLIRLVELTSQRPPYVIREVAEAPGRRAADEAGRAKNRD